MDNQNNDSTPIDSGDDTVNVVDSRGQLVSVPKAQKDAALFNGYREATPDDEHKYVQEQKYGGVGNQVITGLEGAGQAATFGLSTGLETALGVDPENIRGRQETNPGSHFAGEIAGLAGSAAIPGVGAANVLEHAGAAGAEALGLGLEGAGTISKIGSAAVKSGIEGLLVGGGNEVHKMFAQDPNQSLETAATDIGLSGLIGGGIGAGIGSVKGLWNATAGTKLSGVLGAIQNKFGGAAGQAVTEGAESAAPLAENAEASGLSQSPPQQTVRTPADIDDAIAKSGMTIAPEVRAGLGGDEFSSHAFQTLQESPSRAGLQAQKSLQEFKTQAGDTVLNALGKSPEDASVIENMSKYEVGQNVKDTVINELKQRITPMTEGFDEIKQKYGNAPLSDDVKSQIADGISNLGIDEGYNLSPSSSQSQELSRVLKELPNLNNADDLRKYQSILRGNTSSPELYRVGGQIGKILRAGEEHSVLENLTEEAPELLGKHQELRASYKSAMDFIDTLNDRLKVGRYSGPQSFMNALDEMKPEEVLKRISNKNDAGLLSEVLPQLPETMEKVKDYHLNDILKSAVSKANPSESINTKTFYNLLDKMSPELKQFALPAGSDEKINAVRTLLEAVPNRMNPSGTAKTIFSLLKSIPSSALGFGSMVASGNPLIGAAVGGISKLVGTEAPDAIKLSLLKFLGSDIPVSAEGFKAMTEAAQSTIKGESLIKNAVSGIFKSGKQLLPTSAIPTPRSIEKLDKMLQTYQESPEKMMNIGDNGSPYLPEHSQAQGELAMRAVNYLNSLRPDLDNKSPLDTQAQANPIQKAAFDRALKIAEQPLMILQHVKDGTINAQDLTTFQTIFPSLQQKLSQQLMSGIIDHTHKKGDIPYQTRMGLSFMMGQPLDSTMSPRSIMATQNVFSNPQRTPSSMPQRAPAMSSMKGLSQMPQQDATPQQMRIMNRKM